MRLKKLGSLFGFKTPNWDLNPMNALDNFNKTQLQVFGSFNKGVNSFFGNAYASLLGNKDSLLNKLFNMSPSGQFANLSNNMKLAVIVIVVAILGVIGVIALKTML